MENKEDIEKKGLIMYCRSYHIPYVFGTSMRTRHVHLNELSSKWFAA